METGLFEIQAAHLRDYRQNRPLLPGSRDVIHAVLQRPDSGNADAASYSSLSIMETVPDSGKKVDLSAVEFADAFCG